MRIKAIHRHALFSAELSAEEVVDNYLYQESNHTECQIKSLEYKVQALSKLIAQALTEDQVKEIIKNTYGWELADGN